MKIESNPNLSTQVYEIMQKFSGLAAEIEKFRLNNQYDEAEEKIKVLKSLFKELFEADEVELQLVEATLNQDSQFFNDHLVNTLNIRLSGTDFFDGIEKDVVEVAHKLRDEPFNLDEDESVNAQKIGFLIAVKKKTEDPAGIMGWSKTLSEYLSKELEVSESKLQELFDQIQAQSNQLFEKYYHQVECILYMHKIVGEIPVKEHNFLGMGAGETQQRFDDKQQCLIQLLKHMEAIVDLKAAGSKDIAKLELEWGKFNKILEQAFNASPTEVHEIGLALDEGLEKFQEVFAPFMLKNLFEEFPMDDFKL